MIIFLSTFYFVLSRIAAHLAAREFSRVPGNEDWYSLPDDPALEKETLSSILRPQAAGEKLN